MGQYLADQDENGGIWRFRARSGLNGRSTRRICTRVSKAECYRPNRSASGCGPARSGARSPGMKPVSPAYAMERTLQGIAADCRAYGRQEVKLVPQQPEPRRPVHLQGQEAALRRRRPGRQLAALALRHRHPDRKVSGGMTAARRADPHQPRTSTRSVTMAAATPRPGPRRRRWAEGARFTAMCSTEAGVYGTEDPGRPTKGTEVPRGPLCEKLDAESALRAQRSDRHHGRRQADCGNGACSFARAPPRQPAQTGSSLGGLLSLAPFQGRVTVRTARIPTLR